MMSNVQVAVRARPLNQREIDLDSPVIIRMEEKCTTLFKTIDGVVVGQTRDDSKVFEYDHSFWSVQNADKHFVPQEQVYNCLGKSVLESAFKGYNACVFAYGQTGSGKTYTMMGSEDSPGLIPRICQNLFARTAAGQMKKVSYRVEASYMEIYNEKVRDLLLPTSGGSSPHSLKVREHPKDGPYVENLSQQLVTDYDSIHTLMRKGNSHRATAATKMNDVSSRSHAIFTLIFTQAVYSGDLPCETVSKIHLVDLAGSERASTTGAEGLRLREGGNINKSLACLGNVISALAEMSSGSNKQKKVHIPYRDSVLTWLLKDSLGGNSKTIMIATVSPAQDNYAETLSTLRYASRAKNILNRPVVNEDPNVRLIRDLKAEIQRLKKIISSGSYEEGTRQRSGSHLLAEHIHKKEEQIAELTKSWAGKWTGMTQMLEERNLELHAEGIKMTVATERPHFLAIDDLSATGVVIYQLQDGETTLGSPDCSSPRDIVLNADDIAARHCSVTCSEGCVTLCTQDGDCSVNTLPVVTNQNLNHGDLVQLGQYTYFRFNNPLQATTSDEITKSTLLNLSTLSRESEKEKLEKEYAEKLNAVKEELGKERDALQEELENLKQQNALKSDSNSSVVEVDGYNVMTSIGVIDHSKERVKLGPEVEDHEVPNSTSTPIPIAKRSHSNASSCNIGSPKMDSFVNILSEDEKAKGLLDQSIIKVDLKSNNGMDFEGEAEFVTGRNGLDHTDHNTHSEVDGSVPHLLDKENDQLKKKVDELEAALQKKNSLKPRPRSCAFGVVDSPRNKRGYMRRRSNSMRSLSTALIIDIPEAVLRGNGLSSYHLYVVSIELGRDRWKVFKSYNQFSQLHDSLRARYPELSSLTLPPSKWFGVKKPAFVEQRRTGLKVYLQSLLAICMNLAECPLYDPYGSRLTKEKLLKLSNFFLDGQNV